MRIDAKTVVIAEDDPSLRVLMGRCLEQRGCLALVAKDGRDALRIIERYPDPIDLLITDVMMPNVDGFTLAAQASQERPGIKILYVSGHAESSHEVGSGLQGSGRLYLKKPYRRDEFLQVVDRTLNLSVNATDAVSLMLSHPALRVQAVRTWRPEGGVHRSPRYRLETPIQFRLPDANTWEDGVLRDLSRSGMRFDTMLSVEDRALLRCHPPVDIRVPLPRRKGCHVKVLCRGELVRSTRSDTPTYRQGLAVTVANYTVDIRSRRTLFE